MEELGTGQALPLCLCPCHLGPHLPVSQALLIFLTTWRGRQRLSYSAAVVFVHS